LIRPLIVGVAVGGSTALIAWSPLIPDPLALHSIVLALIGAIYVGFGLSDGRVSMALLEVSVATAFLVLALLGLWWAPILIAAGLALHGLWDLAHRPRGIPTRLPSWYPLFCAAVDFVLAGAFVVLAGELVSRT
jgi:hypothetical protein